MIPVYNEERLIGEVVGEWCEVLSDLDTVSEIHLYDDGSTDGTPRLLEELRSRHPSVVVHRHENRGHGPTILAGYREVEADWIFQADGDGEIPAAQIQRIWARRQDYDILLGRRDGRTSSFVRRLVSFGARVCIRVLFGRAIRDVNTPFRLIRKEWLESAVGLLPRDALTPNLLLSGLAARQGARILEVGVSFRHRPARPSWLGSWKLLRFCMASLVEVARFSVAASRSGSDS